MKKGLVFGKFMPPHKGHLALIDKAYNNCDLLQVLLCYTKEEPIPGELRVEWMTQVLMNYPSTILIPYCYNPQLLPNTSVASEEVSELWAAAFQQLVPDTDILFTSEKYGEYVSRFMHIEHMLYDEMRSEHPISATAIRENPFLHWDWIAEPARRYFVKKVAILGSESTGKSLMAKNLAKYFHTSYVPEMARDIVEKTDTCTIDDLYKIASLQATHIQKELQKANRILFSDTDLTTTASYAAFLFNHQLEVSEEIRKINQFDLYLFLETDCPFVQDGTRLDEAMRNSLSRHHEEYLHRNNIPFTKITGRDWDSRQKSAIDVIHKKFPQL
ncbi:MAG TPA: AAA family ATPase [Chitinophagaceae bacterium]